MTSTQIIITVCGVLIADLLAAMYCLVRARGAMYKAAYLELRGQPVPEELKHKAWWWTRRADFLFPAMRMTTKTGWRDND